MWNVRQATEVFHLLFLRALAARVDPALYCLKGGCNLRFFCKSIRYSEDIDLDVRTIPVGTLRRNVDAILENDAFVRTLRAQEILLDGSAAAKQTQTTQRWKVRIRTGISSPEIPTKIEFSRRRFDPDLVLESVDSEIITGYRLYPVLVQHYTPATAFVHKIEALALRTETQARHVFDIKLLLDAQVTPLLDARVRKLVPHAIDNAMGIVFEDFLGQVVAYLDPEYQLYYRAKSTWEKTQDAVITALQGLPE